MALWRWANLHQATRDLMRACGQCEWKDGPDYTGRVYVCEWHHGFDQGYTVGQAEFS